MLKLKMSHCCPEMPACAFSTDKDYVFATTKCCGSREKYIDVLHIVVRQNKCVTSTFC